LLTYLEADLNL